VPDRRLQPSRPTSSVRRSRTNARLPARPANNDSAFHGDILHISKLWCQLSFDPAAAADPRRLISDTSTRLLEPRQHGRQARLCVNRHPIVACGAVDRHVPLPDIFEYVSPWALARVAPPAAAPGPGAQQGPSGNLEVRGLLMDNRIAADSIGHNHLAVSGTHAAVDPLGGSHRAIHNRGKKRMRREQPVLPDHSHPPKQTAAVVDQAKAVNAQSAAAAGQVELLRAQTESLWRQSDAAEAALNASIRPLITSVPRPTIMRIPIEQTDVWRMVPSQVRQVPPATEIDASEIREAKIDDRPTLLVPVRNVGSGVARLVRAALSTERLVTPSIYVQTKTPPSVIGVDEVANIVFSTGEEHEPMPGWLEILLGGDEPLLVEVRYTDVAGRQETATTIVLKRNYRGQFRTERVSLLVEPHLTTLPLR
jgi:hypothetical protein